MIRIDFGTDDRQGIVFRWACAKCLVDDQAFEEDEGIDTIAWHLRKYHDRDELVRFATILTKGMATAAKAVHLPDPEYADQVDRIAESMAFYIAEGSGVVA